jgi:hypothetical protein
VPALERLHIICHSCKMLVTAPSCSIWMPAHSILYVACGKLGAMRHAQTVSSLMTVSDVLHVHVHCISILPA